MEVNSFLSETERGAIPGIDEQQRMERHLSVLACISPLKHKYMISWRASSKAIWLRGIGPTLNCARSLFRGQNPVIVIYVKPVLALCRNPALGRSGSHAVPSTPIHVLLLLAQPSADRQGQLCWPCDHGELPRAHPEPAGGGNAGLGWRTSPGAQPQAALRCCCSAFPWDQVCI